MCSVHWEDIIIPVGDIIIALGEGVSSVLGKYHQCTEDMSSFNLLNVLPMH